MPSASRSSEIVPRLNALFAAVFLIQSSPKCLRSVLTTSSNTASEREGRTPVMVDLLIADIGQYRTGAHTGPRSRNRTVHPVYYQSTLAPWLSFPENNACRVCSMSYFVVSRRNPRY